jgi:DNA replication and repair protein RecF
VFLESIKLSQFKNYEDAEFLFCNNFNVIVGENGAGKTNLLDAIHYLSFCKSYFSSQDIFSIRFDADFFAIHGNFVSLSDHLSSPVSCSFKKQGRKVMKLHQKEYQSLSEHIGKFPLIMIAPQDHVLINEGSEIRRKYIDMLISQFDKKYLRYLIEYQKIITQRNTLLKQFIEKGYFQSDLLQIYEYQLIEPAQYIFEKRKSCIAEMLPFFLDTYQFLSNSKESVAIEYLSGLFEMTLLEGFRENEHKDRKWGFTHFGIHKDDFAFYINEHSVKKFASQGQQKSFAISLKLAQYQHIVKSKGLKPILLLDDIFDKLDMARMERLLEFLAKENVGQVFISDAHENRIHTLLEQYRIEHKIFHITR